MHLILIKNYHYKLNLILSTTNLLSKKIIQTSNAKALITIIPTCSPFVTPSSFPLYLLFTKS